LKQGLFKGQIVKARQNIKSTMYITTYQLPAVVMFQHDWATQIRTWASSPLTHLVSHLSTATDGNSKTAVCSTLLMSVLWGRS